MGWIWRLNWYLHVVFVLTVSDLSTDLDFSENTSCEFICVPLQCDLPNMRPLGWGLTTGVWNVSVAPFDTVSFPEKQETKMVVWCFSTKDWPSMCSLYAPDHTSEWASIHCFLMFLWASVWFCSNKTGVANPCPLIPAWKWVIANTRALHKCVTFDTLFSLEFIHTDTCESLQLPPSAILLIPLPPLPTSSLHFLPPPTHSFLPLFAFAA